MGKKLLAFEYFKAPPYDVLLDPRRYVGRWDATFGRVAPLHVEVGMGLGHHMLAYAQVHPEYNHLALEMKMHRIYTARHLFLRHGLRNVRFVPGDGIRTLDVLESGSVHRLTILFSDPWPKHPDRRLTAPQYLTLYKRILGPAGLLHLRTDDPDFFAFTLAGLDRDGWAYIAAVPIQRVLTGFERRWLAEGRQIYGVDAWIPQV
jgi:tRNA (guanine-N7-)-methyltransferase